MVRTDKEIKEHGQLDSDDIQQLDDDFNVVQIGGINLIKPVTQAEADIFINKGFVPKSLIK